MTNSDKQFARASNPSNSSLIPLTQRQLERLFKDNQRAVTLLVELEMVAVRTAEDHYLLGYQDSQVPEHDSWFFTYRPRPVNDLENVWEWRSVEQPDMPGSGGGHLTFPELLTQMEFLKTTASETRLELMVEYERILGPSEILGAARSMNCYDERLLEVNYDMSLHDLHDLIHHPEVFIARHPDHAEVPRELLLALNGLTDPYLVDSPHVA